MRRRGPGIAIAIAIGVAGSATARAAPAAEEDVVVGAAGRAQPLGGAAAAVTVISAERLRRFGYRTIGEAVAGVAGAYLVDNRLSSSIGIRGLQIPGDPNTRILVLVDGARVNEAWGASAGLGDGALVGLDEIARIEVIRGPGSSVYGTNALLGVIHVVTRGAAESPRAWARAAGQTIHGVATSAGFAAGGGDRELRGAVRLLHRFGESGLPALHGLEPQPHGDRARALHAGLAGASGGSFAQVRAVRYARASPFAPHDTPPGGAAYEQTERLVLVEGGHARELSGRLSAAGRVFASLYRHAASRPPGPEGYRLDTTGAAQVYGAELRGRYELVRDRLGLTAGAEARHERTRATAEQRGRPGGRIPDVVERFDALGAYAELEGQPAAWLGVTGGLRLDHHARLEARLSPRAALRLGRSARYGAKLLHARGFRNPSAYEAYFDDGAALQRAEGLRAETLRSYEAVLWARPWPGVAVRLSGFDWDARGLIERAPVTDGGVAKLQHQNVARHVTRGLEAEASYRDRCGWYAFAGAAVARVGARDGAGALAFGDVANAPVVTASVGVSTPRLLGLAHLSTEAILIGARPTRPDLADPAAPAPSPRAPAWVGWSVVAYAPDLGGFDVTLGVRNVLGRRDLIPAPPAYDRTAGEARTVPRVPGEGRELQVQIGYAY